MCLAVPGKITEIEEEDGGLRFGTADFGGVSKRVCLSYVPEAGIGDYVLVHVGFAISRVDEEEARSVFDELRRVEGLGKP